MQLPVSVSISASVAVAEVGRPVVKATVGLPPEADGTGEGRADLEALCLRVLDFRGPVAEDDGRSPRGAFLGVPLISPTGLVLGVLGVIGGRDRSWTDEDVRTLGDFAGSVAAEVARLTRSGDGRSEAEEERDRILERAELQGRTFDAALSNTPDFIYVFGLDNRVLYANRALLAMWGRTWEETKGRGFRDLGYEEWHAEMHEREIREVVASRRSIKGEVPFEGTHGRRIYEYIFSPVFDDAGAVASVAGTTRDVSERNRIEAELRDVRIRLESALGAGAMATWVLDMVGDRVYADSNLAALFNVSPQDAAGGRLAAYLRAVHDEDRGIIESAIRRATERNEPGIEVEYRVNGADGRVRWVVARGKFVRDDAGTPVGLNGAVVDITDRKAAEDALRLSEGRFRSAFANSAVGMALATLDGRFLEANPAYCSITGYSEHELGGQDLLSITHPEDRAPKRRQLRRLLSGEVPSFIIVKRYLRKDGRVVWVQNSVSLLWDARGEPANLIVLTEDITERKRAEEERADLHARERAARVLAEDALRQAELVQLEVEAAGRAKDRFLAMLSHELRTPINPVLLTASAMLDDPSTPESQRPTWRMIRDNIGLEARLIDDLLDVMRTIQGKMTYQWEVVDAHDLLRKTEGIVRSDAHAKRIRMETGLEAPRSHVRADSARLTQAFWNLVRNALKFTDEGGAITIRSRNEGDRLVVEVSDTGIGIEPEALGKIFNAFEQAEDSITRRFGGLGLGLAISKSVVDAHLGSLTAVSPGPGLGATFTIELPTTAPLPLPADGPTGLDPQGRPARKACKILLVEDDAMTCRVMSTLLRKAGHAVTTAIDYENALAVASPDFDLVVSDVGLPGRSGFDLMKELRARHDLKGIALTGFGQEDDLEKSRQAGFRFHLTKPVNFQKLEETIQQVVAEASRP